MTNSDDDEDDNGEDRESEEEEAARETSAGMAAYLHYVRKVIEKYLLYVDPGVNQEEATQGITELVKQGVKVAKKVHEVGTNSQVN